MAEDRQPEDTQLPPTLMEEGGQLPPRFKPWGDIRQFTPKILPKFLELPPMEQNKVWDRLDDKQKQTLFQKFVGELASVNEGMNRANPANLLTKEEREKVKSSVLSVSPLRIMARLVSGLSSNEKHQVSVEDAEDMLLSMGPQTGLISSNTLAARVVKALPPES